MAETCGALDQVGFVCERTLGHPGPHRAWIEWSEDMRLAPNVALVPAPETEEEVDRLFADLEQVAGDDLLAVALAALPGTEEDNEPQPFTRVPPPAPTAQQAPESPGILVNGVWVFPDPVSQSSRCLVCGHATHPGMICQVIVRLGGNQVPCDCRGT